MRQALDELVVDGIRTNAALHRELVTDSSFMAGGVGIHYLESKLEHEHWLQRRLAGASLHSPKDQIDALEEWFCRWGTLSPSKITQISHYWSRVPARHHCGMWCRSPRSLRVILHDLKPVLAALPEALATEAPGGLCRWRIVSGSACGRISFSPCKWASGWWICPSWTPPPEPDAVNLLLDPGLAFGTGTHPTTAMCLRALDAASLETTRIVDYGCGSGILGIAAAACWVPSRYWGSTTRPKLSPPAKAMRCAMGYLRHNFLRVCLMRWC